MKFNTTDFRRKCQHPLLLALGSLPLGVIVMQSLAAQMLNRFWFLPLAYVLLGWACIVIPGKWRVAAGVAGMAGMLALGFALLPVTKQFFLVLVPLIYVGLLVVTLPIGGWPRSQELAVGWHVGGVCIHVVGQIAVNVARRTGNAAYDGVAPVLLVAFLLYAALLLLALNRASLDSAAMSRRTVPLLMRRQNLVITLALLALGTLIAAIPAIGSALDRLWKLIMQGVMFIAALIASLMPQRSGGSGGTAAPPDDVMSLGAANEPSLLAIIMEKVIGILALIVLVVALFFAGRALLKKLIRLARYLWGRLGQYSAAAGEDYEDEITDTRDESDTDREGALAPFLARLRNLARDEKGLSPAERVRRRYQRLRLRHADWGRASTARETLPGNAAELYERARYDGQALTDAEATRFQEETRRV